MAMGIRGLWKFEHRLTNQTTGGQMTHTQPEDKKVFCVVLLCVQNAWNCFTSPDTGPPRGVQPEAASVCFLVLDK